MKSKILWLFETLDQKSCIRIRSIPLKGVTWESGSIIPRTKLSPVSHLSPTLSLAFFMEDTIVRVGKCCADTIISIVLWQEREETFLCPHHLLTLVHREGYFYPLFLHSEVLGKIFHPLCPHSDLLFSIRKVTVKTQLLEKTSAASQWQGNGADWKGQDCLLPQLQAQQASWVTWGACLQDKPSCACVWQQGAQERPLRREWGGWGGNPASVWPVLSQAWLLGRLDSPSDKA